jgi:FtsP/CotA-like multicopper oxidase with cupredoxin domain
MAGLGQNVGNTFALRSLMNGSATIGGQTLGVWYFAPQDGSNIGRGFMADRQFPSVHLEVIEGQDVSIDFFNQSFAPHTIHLHGLDVDQQNDGVPQTSAAVAPQTSFTYQFVAPHAGTYHYHCHVDTVLHYARGMFGAIVVRPPDGALDRAWDGGPTFDEEALWHLHSVDPTWFNHFVSGPALARYRPTGFLINGKETADASTDPFTRIVVGRGQRTYLRLLNADYNWTRVSLGGMRFEVVASDGRPMQKAPTVTQWELGPGERYDLLFSAPPVAGTHVATVEFLSAATSEVIGTAETVIEVI